MAMVVTQNGKGGVRHEEGQDGEDDSFHFLELFWMMTHDLSGLQRCFR